MNCGRTALISLVVESRR